MSEEQYETRSQSARTLTDKEIAQDILTSHKYLSNYYYAPAILESMDPKIRGIFQKIHQDTQEEAKMVFDYLHSRGWYNPRQADSEALNDLTRTAQESNQIISSLISQEGTSQSQGGTQMIGREFQGSETGNWQGWNQPQVGWQQGANQPQMSGWQQTFGARQWGGSQGQFQGGLSAGYQGTRWGGQPGWNQGAQMPWQGIQAGEGQSGMGPSSLYQWTRWGGQPSWTQGASGFSQGGASTPAFGWQSQSLGQSLGQGYQQGYAQGISSSWQQPGQSWQGSGQAWQVPQAMSFAQNWQQAQNPGYRQWTGTEQGEGQSGMGPSSLYQSTRWGGQPSWTSSPWSGASF